MEKLIISISLGLGEFEDNRWDCRLAWDFGLGSATVSGKGMCYENLIVHVLRIYLYMFYQCFQ